LPVFLAALAFFKSIAPVDDDDDDDDEGQLLPRKRAAASTRTGTKNDRRNDGLGAKTLLHSRLPTTAA
jgi:hypothetical protein